MYLSKVLVKAPACRNPYDIHRALWKGFPENADAKRDFLFCVEQSDYESAEILMQSDRRPEIPYDSIHILACKSYQPVFVEGHRLGFRLIANPIKMINDENGRQNSKGETKKCRVPLIREEDQRAWIERKVVAAASIETLSVDPVSPVKFRKTRDDRAGKIQPVRFQGILKVEDAGAMTVLLQNGIGPAKAFGCGLMLVRRV